MSGLAGELTGSSLPPSDSVGFYLVIAVDVVETGLGFDSPRSERPKTETCP